MNPGLVMKSTCSTKRRFSCFIATIMLVEARDVVAAAGARKARLRLRRIADERRVEVSVLVDLGAAHEADIDIAALEQQQHFGAARAPCWRAWCSAGRWSRAAASPARRRRRSRRPRTGSSDPGNAAAARASRPAEECRRRRTPPGHPSAARAEDRQHLRRGVAARLSHRRCSGPCGSRVNDLFHADHRRNSFQDFGP